MAIDLEKIELLKERADVTYEEARDALEKCNGSLVEAIIYLEKSGKIKPPPRETQTATGFWATLNKYIKIGNETRLVVSKDGRVVTDLSLIIVLLLTIILPPLVLVLFLLAIFSGHNIRLEKPGSAEMPINKTFEDMTSAASKVTEQVKDALNKK
ncbi:MAG: DUF4342 domain-containing protein [Syntrophomonadaceae bacterium]|nr:DUF4342 domain-containing protein [Syntrophomonadaceae bacterium]